MSHGTRSSRQERKISYEKERREKLSILFKELTEALLASGWPPETVETQVGCLSIAIDIIKKTTYDGTQAREPKGYLDDENGNAELPENYSGSSPIKVPIPLHFCSDFHNIYYYIILNFNILSGFISEAG